jgi:hypothetical protein
METLLILTGMVTLILLAGCAIVGTIWLCCWLIDLNALVCVLKKDLDVIRPRYASTAYVNAEIEALHKRILG